MSTWSLMEGAGIRVPQREWYLSSMSCSCLAQRLIIQPILVSSELRPGFLSYYFENLHIKIKHLKQRYLISNQLSVIEVSSGEYGSHVDRMVTAVENGRCQRWREYAVNEPVVDLEELDIEQLNTGGVEKLNYQYGSTGCQQFFILLRRMLLQTIRNTVRREHENLFFCTQKWETTYTQ